METSASFEARSAPLPYPTRESEAPLRAAERREQYPAERCHQLRELLLDRREVLPVLRGVIWIALVICALMDGALGDYMIGGPAHFSDVFCWNCPPTPLTLSDWVFTGGFLVFQAALILILIRTRRNRSQVTVVPK